VRLFYRGGSGALPSCGVSAAISRAAPLWPVSAAQFDGSSFHLGTNLDFVLVDIPWVMLLTSPPDDHRLAYIPVIPLHKVGYILGI